MTAITSAEELVINIDDKNNEWTSKTKIGVNVIGNKLVIKLFGSVR